MARNQAPAQDGPVGELSRFRESFLGGMRAGAGLAVAVFVLGLTLGALAPADGWGLIAPLAGTSDGRYRHAVPSTRLMPSGLT